VRAATFAAAQRAAAATGKMFLFGVRPNGSVFVRCDDIEIDGNWDGSVPALVTEISQRLLAERRMATVAITDADKKLRVLDGAS